METVEGEDGLRIVIAVTKIGPGGVPPQLYVMSIDADGGSMSPEDELSECFDVFHEHEVCDDLNPTLRRLWKTARIADEIASRLLQSGALALVRTDETSDEEA
jgi:hypothetical protein